MNEKKRLREALKQKRASLDETQKREWDRAIIKKIAASRQFQTASALLLYAPTRGEINLLPLVRLSWQMGKTVAFPRCDVETTTMHFYLLAPGAKLVRGAYGIAEPPQDAPLCVPDENTLCILPALTFSLAGDRLGYGKGYYDRFLEHFPGMTAGAAYQAFLVKRVPTEEHDRAVQTLFTERGAVKLSRDEGAESASRETETQETREDAQGAKPAETPRTSLWKRLWKGIFSRAVSGTAVAVAAVGGDQEHTAPAARVLHAPPILVAVTFVLLLLSRLIDTALTDRRTAYLMVILLQLLIFFAPALVYVLKREKGFAKRLRIRLPSPKHLWFIFCMLAVMISGGLLCGILTGGISSLTGNFTLYDTFVARTDGSFAETVYVILAYGVLPAVCEELIWRGILCAEYEGFGAGVSILLSAIFFAMLHFSFPLLLSYLFLGLLLAGVMYATRSIIAAMLLHLCYNLFCLFGQPYLSAFYVTAGSNEIFVFCLVVILLLFGAFAAGEARKIYHVRARRNTDASYTAPLPLRRLPKQLWRAVASPAAAVCAVIWLVMSILNLVL
ncbi:MAG: 5-formyltetrahydrofolate cyclo-ligase [Clostridia bacterium]|nr:5-formyltetrahydrofolate cyclo-ligase [Clostridia bacterium]